MRYCFLFLVVIFYSFKTEDRQSNFTIIELLQDENILSKKLLCMYIGNNYSSKYQFKSTGDYIGLKNYQIGVIEGENKNEVIRIALIFKDSILVKKTELKAVKKNGNVKYFIGNLYTVEENSCPTVVQIKYEAFRIDTLKMKFDIRMAKEKNTIKKSYCK